MNALHLVYFADPMCSWCWGFSPVVEAIRAKYGESLPIRLIMGGLRPGTREPMDEAAKRSTRSHWEHVHEASGQPFDFSFFDRQGFVYDTEPAARAVVLARRDDPARGFDYLRRVHAGFYAENKDVTQVEILADLAGEIGFDRMAFLEGLHSDEAMRETQHDFVVSRRSGITGFPTLIAGTGSGGSYALVTQGFQSVERIVPAIENWLNLHRVG
jgi:putative protein-disulfide isomerase